MTECEEHEWITTNKGITGEQCLNCDKEQTLAEMELDVFASGYSLGKQDAKAQTLKVAKRIAHELITDEALRATYIETLVTQLNRKDRNKPYCPICEELHDFPAKCWAEQQDKEIPDGN